MTFEDVNFEIIFIYGLMFSELFFDVRKWEHAHCKIHKILPTLAQGVKP